MQVVSARQNQCAFHTFTLYAIRCNRHPSLNGPYMKIAAVANSSLSSLYNNNTYVHVYQ